MCLAGVEKARGILDSLKYRLGSATVCDEVEPVAICHGQCGIPFSDGNVDASEHWPRGSLHLYGNDFAKIIFVLEVPARRESLARDPTDVLRTQCFGVFQKKLVGDLLGPTTNRCSASCVPSTWEV